ncbi:hypothetical protein WA158_004872 [Blastocystis sp. Blastoise]
MADRKELNIRKYTVVPNIHLNEVRMIEVPHMKDRVVITDQNRDDPHLVNKRMFTGPEGTSYYNDYQTDYSCILADIVRKPNDKPYITAYVRGGPRSKLWFNPKKSNAVIVTCGGLCPGLNNVIREVTCSLIENYGVEHVYGIYEGYSGFEKALSDPSYMVDLTLQFIATIHHEGGSILKSSRGGFNADKIIEWCLKYNVNMIYVIGGDGTHRGATVLFEEIEKRNLNIAVAGIPKTIDNDIAMVDRSFGFDTAVQESLHAIHSAWVEATCAPNGIGLVKLMGRDAGFIAAFATISSHDVDLCLIPEVPVVFDDPEFPEYSIIPYIESILKLKKHCVIVVSEGVQIQGVQGSGTDESGNKRYADVGKFLKDYLTSTFAERGNPVSVKYIDPSYMIRTTPANAFDSQQCLILAENVVHGVMAGYTGFTVGLCNNRTVYIPIEMLTDNSPRYLYPFGRTYERVVNITNQPDFSQYMKIQMDRKAKLAAEKVDEKPAEKVDEPKA